MPKASAAQATHLPTALPTEDRSLPSRGRVSAVVAISGSRSRHEPPHFIGARLLRSKAADDPSAAKHHETIAQCEELSKILRDEQHAGASISSLEQQVPRLHRRWQVQPPS